MLEPPPASDDKNAGTDSALSAALKCAHRVMQQRIISNPKDMMGIILFNTEKSKSFAVDGREKLAFPHCYVYTELDVPSADEVKELKSLAEGEEDADEILEPSSSEPADMQNLLYLANQIFTNRAPNFGSRRLFLITDNDDPYADKKAASTQARQRAKDLHDLGITLELFPITRGDAIFDISKFYTVRFYSSQLFQASF
jgi:ATP-dependent DNA helicase 2 subunit 1